MEFRIREESEFWQNFIVAVRDGQADPKPFKGVWSAFSLTFLSDAQPIATPPGPKWYRRIVDQTNEYVGRFVISHNLGGSGPQNGFEVPPMAYRYPGCMWFERRMAMYIYSLLRKGYALVRFQASLLEYEQQFNIRINRGVVSVDPVQVPSWIKTLDRDKRPSLDDYLTDCPYVKPVRHRAKNV